MRRRFCGLRTSQNHSQPRFRFFYTTGKLLSTYGSTPRTKQTSNQSSPSWSERSRVLQSNLSDHRDSLLQKLLYDLRTTLTPRYETLWDTLLAQATRSLPPAAFETYIQTLSLFLKHLLLPSPDNCKRTWIKLSDTMRKSRPDVRRKLAEVWGTALRRLKSETRREMTDLLLDSLNVIQDAVAWVYITAFQSTSSTVHTSAVSLLKMLWDSALTAEDFDAVSRLLRRILSATMHYCTIESFQTMANLVTTLIQTMRSTPQSEERNWRIMETTLVVCAFRKGRHAESMLNCG